MNNRYSSSGLVALNFLAILGYIFIARTPPQSTADILWFAVAAFGVYGTALLAIAIEKG
jgi:hypothetical protein